MAILNKSIVILFFIFISIIDASFVTNRLNIEPDYNTNHTIIYSGISSDVNITIPDEMVFVNASSGYSLSSGMVSWSGVSYAKVVLADNSTVFEGDIITSELYLDNILSDTIDFVVVPDSKIGDCKSELGHGTANWLDTSYLPEGDSSLFNMIRIYPLGSYYNEDAENASVNCTFPKYHILVSQGNLGTFIEHHNNTINARFYWDNLGKNWFRVAPLEQEITDAAIGDTYNIVCSDVNYQYSQGNVTAPLSCLSFEFRNDTALNHSLSGGNITISNEEEYTIYDVEFSWIDGDIESRKISYMSPGDIVYISLGEGNFTVKATYIPEWWHNSIHNEYTEQSFDVDYSIPVTTTNTNPSVFPVTAKVIEPTELDGFDTCTFIGITGPFILGLCWSFWFILIIILILLLIYFYFGESISNFLFKIWDYMSSVFKDDSYKESKKPKKKVSISWLED